MAYLVERDRDDVCVSAALHAECTYRKNHNGTDDNHRIIDRESVWLFVVRCCERHIDSSLLFIPRNGSNRAPSLVCLYLTVVSARSSFVFVGFFCFHSLINFDASGTDTQHFALDRAQKKPTPILHSTIYGALGSQQETRNMRTLSNCTGRIFFVDHKVNSIEPIISMFAWL